MKLEDLLTHAPNQDEEKKKKKNIYIYIYPCKCGLMVESARIALYDIWQTRVKWFE